MISLDIKQLQMAISLNYLIEHNIWYP